MIASARDSVRTKGRENSWGRCVEKTGGPNLIPKATPEEGSKMLLKSVYQWDIDSADDLAKFREDSGQMHQQVERVIYRRSDNIAPGKFVETPRCKAPQENGKSAR